MKKIIVNADDLGYALGVNEGIIKAHKDGIVTSTSLMVNQPKTKEGIKLASQYPNLSLGLHFWIKREEGFILRQLKKAVSVAFVDRVKQEFIRQINTFQHLVGRMPDHINGHHHVHSLPRIYPFVRKFCKENNIPMRGDVNFISSFFGVPSAAFLTVENFIRILKSLPDGTSEIMCHPGFSSSDLNSSYMKERELELSILVSDEVKVAIRKLGINLVNWKSVVIPGSDLN